MSNGVTDQSICTAKSTGALRLTSLLMACIDCASSGLMTRMASSTFASREPSVYGEWRSSRRMVCVSERSSSSSMTWRTLFSDGVADIAGTARPASAPWARAAAPGSARQPGGRFRAAGLRRCGLSAGADTCAAILGAATGGLAGAGLAAAGAAGAGFAAAGLTAGSGFRGSLGGARLRCAALAAGLARAWRLRAWRAAGFCRAGLAAGFAARRRRANYSGFAPADARPADRSA